jgi:hypothetical protein
MLPEGGVMATDWQKIKQDLSVPFGCVHLRCDGYLVCAVVRQSKMKLIITVYVNGYIEGESIFTGKESNKDKMSDIARKFYFLRLVRQDAYIKKQIKAMEKLYGKRKCKEKGLYDRHIQAVPWFSTPGGFVAHIRKHNESVEIIDWDTFDRELEAMKVKNAEPA